MGRSVTTAFANHVKGAAVHPVFLLDLDFSTPIYFWTGQGTITHNSNNYLGTGDMLSMSEVSEAQDLGATGLTLTLASLQSGSGTLLNKALQEDYQGKDVTLYLGMWDATSLNQGIIADPVVVFKGFMDVMQMTDNEGTATISLKVENKLLKLNRTNVRRYTSQDQRTDYPNDKGFDYVTNIAEKDITWGARTEKAAVHNLAK